MSELSLQTAATCQTNQGWFTQVLGSNGTLYTVRWCYQPAAGVQYDYECTCRGYLMSGRKHCKHIKTVIVEHRRCGWNEILEPTLEAQDGKCPACGGPVVYVQVGV